MKGLCLRSASAMLVLFFTTADLKAQAGNIDPTFLSANVNGAVYAIALQSDGKVVIGGNFTQVNDSIANRITRLLPNGVLDGSFDSGSGADGAILNLAIQPNGKILAGGIFNTLNGSGSGLARLNADGSRDTNFGTGSLPYVYALACHGSGSIYIARDNQVRRLHSNGIIDTTFSLLIPPEGFGGFASSVDDFRVQPDGKILFGGNFYEVNGQSRFRLGRLIEDGTLDLSFIPDAAGSSTEVTAIGLRSDGKFYAAGRTLKRLEPEGTVDTNFAFPQSGLLFDCVAVQQDGKPLVGGNFSDVGGRQMFARFNNNGAVDPMFSGHVNNFVEAIAVQPDGRILIGGAFTTVNGIPHLRIARLLGDAPVITSHRSGANAVISWAAAYTNYLLQTSSNLSLTNWPSVTNSTTVVSNMCVVTNPITSGSHFFRLASP